MAGVSDIYPLWRRGLRDRVVLLTGASAGIGRATTLRLAARGATLVAVARDSDALDKVAAEAEGVVVPHPCDITVDADRARVVEDTLLRHGRIDVLVNNVGIGWAGRFEEMPLDAVRTLVEANVVAAV